MTYRVVIWSVACALGLGIAYLLAGGGSAFGDPAPPAQPVHQAQTEQGDSMLLAARQSALPTAIPELDKLRPADFETASFALG